MRRSTSLALPFLLAPWLVAPAAKPIDEIAFAPEDGSSVTKTFARTLELAGEETMTVVRNGEEGTLYRMSIDRSESWRIVLADDYLAVADGRPRRLSRTFEEISVEMEVVLLSEVVSVEGESDLEGMTVVFTWDEEEEEYRVEFAEETDGDAELLEGLVEDADLRDFLPGEERDEGDEWEVDATEAMARLLFPGGDLAVVLDAEEDTRRPFEDALWKALQGEITCTYRGTRDEDGVEVAVIGLEGELEAEATESSETDADAELLSGQTEIRKAVELELEGELLWSVELGRVYGLSVEAEVRSSFESVSSRSTDDFEFERRTAQTFEGTLVVELGTE